MANKIPRKEAGEWPAITENHWYVMAIATAVFTALALFAAFIWIFIEDKDAAHRVLKAQAIAPFGVAAFAFIAFLTASWRGSINTRQANQAESEGRAKLLQEGAKLLAESEKPAHVAAGIATLEILLASEDVRLAVQAMNLIADFIQREMASDHKHLFREPAFAALATGANRGLTAERDLRFVTNDAKVEWAPVVGVRKVSYDGGRIQGIWSTFEFKDRPNYTYSNANISFMTLSVDDHRCQYCSIDHCEIIHFRAWVTDLLTLRFCDFSGASINVNSVLLLDGFKDKGNYFYGKKPPVFILGGIPADPARCLLRRETDELRYI